ncbi:hypothetical protein F4803DRAFT_553026 [Xylaria telfairii]|nr:hypothetical protein F4803DRAFT_553026 [Xylaria telfairii]
MKFTITSLLILLTATANSGLAAAAAAANAELSAKIAECGRIDNVMIVALGLPKEIRSSSGRVGMAQRQDAAEATAGRGAAATSHKDIGAGLLLEVPAPGTNALLMSSAMITCLAARETTALHAAAAARLEESQT